MWGMIGDREPMGMWDDLGQRANGHGDDLGTEPMGVGEHLFGEDICCFYWGGGGGVLIPRHVFLS